MNIFEPKRAQFVNVIAEQRCNNNNNFYQNVINAKRITTVDQICMFPQVNHTCISDSGGPFIADYEPENSLRHMVLIGIQSFGSQWC